MPLIHHPSDDILNVLRYDPDGKEQRNLFELILIVGVLIVDQVTKFLTEAKLMLGETYPLWDGVFEFANVHNTGAAWGMFAGGRWIFIVITVAACALMAYILVKLRKDIGIVAQICLALLIAGAVGNLIDRVWFGYVRDMLYFSLINFPVFNVADSAVCIGAGLLIADTLFIKHGSLFDALEPWLESKPKAEIETESCTEEATTAECAVQTEETAVEKTE